MKQQQNNYRYDNEQPEIMGGDGGGLIGALINTGAGLYDSYQNRKTSKQNTDKTIAANKSEAELAYQREMEMWRLQNLYNSPEAQMQRFKEAGLNPHLIYGQGNSGNSTSTPHYNPARAEYNYQPMQYGRAFGQILPTLMSVGSWMQNMRLGEAELDKKRVDTTRAEQIVEYLTSANPKLLEQLDNKLSMYGYQTQAAGTANDIALSKLLEIGEDYKFKYGEDLWKKNFASRGLPGSDADPNGFRKLQFLEQASKTKLAEAKASWSEFDITDPQAIMMLVLNGVMGMAGSAIRMPKARPTSQAPRSIRKRRYDADRDFEDKTRRMRQFGQ